MNSSPPSALERTAAALSAGLRHELELTPKPGLVDRFDGGSHPDLSFDLMHASIAVVSDYFHEIAAALARGEELPELVARGQAAEMRMLAVCGTNTHKGVIFLGGLLLTALARSADPETSTLRRQVAAVAKELFPGQQIAGTHGQTVRRTFGATGIIGESLAGLPNLFDVALPAYRQGAALGWEHRRAAWLAMARLMQSVEDTTTLHRGGPLGLARLRADGQSLEMLLLAGDDPLPFLLRLNHTYRRQRLTMGGVADLLGLTFALLDLDGGLLPAVSPAATFDLPSLSI